MHQCSRVAKPMQCFNYLLRNLLQHEVPRASIHRESVGVQVTSCAEQTQSNYHVYVIAIGWLYVVTMIAVVSDSPLKGVIRFVFLGALPVGLLLWVKLMRYRAREAARAEAASDLNTTQTLD